MTLEKRIEQAKELLHEYFNDGVANIEMEDDISDEFLSNLITDNLSAKKQLRELFRKSPKYDTNLDAIVLDITITSEQSANLIRDAVFEILRKSSLRFNQKELVVQFAIRENPNEDCISFMKETIGKKFNKNRKKSRTLAQLFETLGVADSSKDSIYQKQYAILSDELSTKSQIEKRLYISLNPIHFLIMSNPKRRWSEEEYLTSCQSFNSTEYQYNNACSGLARDETTFIVFSAADGDDRKNIATSKISRELFSYTPYNGVLLQNRLYSTLSSTNQHLSLFYKYQTIITNLINELEHNTDVWEETILGREEESNLIKTNSGFSGYVDWQCQGKNTNKQCSVLIRKDDSLKNAVFVGKAGLCIACAKENDNGLYCEECYHGYYGQCEQCDEHIRADDLIYDENISMYFCENCYHSIPLCEHCKCHAFEERTQNVENEIWCESCIADSAVACKGCGELINVDHATISYNDDCYCSFCAMNELCECKYCGEFYPNDEIHYEESIDAYLCEDCYTNMEASDDD